MFDFDPGTEDELLTDGPYHFTGSTDVPHTHHQFHWAIGSETEIWGKSPLPEENPKFEVLANGQLIQKTEVTGWHGPDENGTWYAEVATTFPLGVGGIVTLPAENAQAGLRFQTSNFSSNVTTFAFLGWGGAYALTPDVSVETLDVTSVTMGTDEEAIFRVYRRNAPLDQPLTVSLGMTGTARLGTDYTLDPSTTVNFAPWEAHRDVILRPLENDRWKDAPFSATAVVQDGPNYLPAGNSATVLVQAVNWTFSFDQDVWSATKGKSTTIKGMLFKNGVADTTRNVAFQLGLTSLHGDTVAGATLNAQQRFQGTFTAGAGGPNRQPVIEALLGNRRIGSTLVNVR